MRHFNFSKNYFVLFVVILLVEIGIALFVRDRLIRPYGGDFLVIILLYCFLKSILEIGVRKTVVIVVLFAFLVELLQYFQILTLLKLDKIPGASVVLGSHFEWLDIFIYLLGGIAILVVERRRDARVAS